MNVEACKIIDQLGGTSAVARHMDAPVSTVFSWRKNGIPASRLAHIRLIAKDLGVSFVAPATPSAGKAPTEDYVRTCFLCSRGMDDPATSLCPERDCPLSQREAA